MTQSVDEVATVRAFIRSEGRGADPQSSLRVREALMRRIGTSLPMEIHGRITWIIGRGRRGLGFLLATLLASPGLDQRAIDREMLAGQQPSFTRHSHDCVEKSLSHGMGQQPLTILS